MNKEYIKTIGALLIISGLMISMYVLMESTNTRRLEEIKFESQIEKQDTGFTYEDENMIFLTQVEVEYRENPEIENILYNRFQKATFCSAWYISKISDGVHDFSRGWQSQSSSERYETYYVHDTFSKANGGVQRRIHIRLGQEEYYVSIEWPTCCSVFAVTYNGTNDSDLELHIQKDGTNEAYGYVFSASTLASFVINDGYQEYRDTNQDKDELYSLYFDFNEWNIKIYKDKKWKSGAYFWHDQRQDIPFIIKLDRDIGFHYMFHEWSQCIGKQKIAKISIFNNEEIYYQLEYERIESTVFTFNNHKFVVTEDIIQVDNREQQTLETPEEIEKILPIPFSKHGELYTKVVSDNGRYITISDEIYVIRSHVCTLDDEVEEITYISLVKKSGPEMSVDLIPFVICNLNDGMSIDPFIYLKLDKISWQLEVKIERLTENNKFEYVASLYITVSKFPCIVNLYYDPTIDDVSYETIY